MFSGIILLFLTLSLLLLMFLILGHGLWETNLETGICLKEVY